MFMVDPLRPKNEARWTTEAAAKDSPPPPQQGPMRVIIEQKWASHTRTGPYIESREQWHTYLDRIRNV